MPEAKDNNLFSITLNIGSQTFSIKIEREQEKTYRDAARLINQKLQQYINTYPGQSNERYFTMALIDISVQLMQERNVDSALRNLTAKLTRALEQPEN